MKKQTRITLDDFLLDELHQEATNKGISLQEVILFHLQDYRRIMQEFAARLELAAGTRDGIK